jgi:hypothetical protein
MNADLCRFGYGSTTRSYQGTYLINLLGILGLLAGVKVVGEPVERLEVMEEMEGDILEAGEGEVDEPRHAEPLLIQAVLHLLHQRLHHLQQ